MWYEIDAIILKYVYSWQIIKYVYNYDSEDWKQVNFIEIIINKWIHLKELTKLSMNSSSDKNNKNKERKENWIRMYLFLTVTSAFDYCKPFIKWHAVIMP